MKGKKKSKQLHTSSSDLKAQVIILVFAVYSQELHTQKSTH